MRQETFWAWFDGFAAPRLIGRDKTFRAMFEHLDRFDRPVSIAETGCVEDPENWRGNGCSTILFDRYVATHPDSAFYSVDIVPAKVELARSLVTSNRSLVSCEDSVAFLKNLALVMQAKPLDLLYLDASHFDWDDPVPAQRHHLDELFAALPALHQDSMVAVDDSPSVMDAFPHVDVGGKGGLVGRYLFSVGADLAFLEYQAGWTNVTARPRKAPQDLQALLARARGHVEADRMTAASPLYDLVLQLTPPPWTGVQRVARGEACAFFARLARGRNRLGTAADWYVEALRCDPRATDYRIELATKCLLPIGALDSAIAEAERGSRIEPDHDKAWRILGQLHHERGNAAKAVAAFERQIAVRPDDPDAILDRCTIALDLEDYGLVKTLCAKAMGTRREADAWHILAMATYREGRHEQAIELYDKAIAMDCFDVPITRWHKSQALESIGRYAEAWRERVHRKDQQQTPALAVPMNRFNAPLWHRDRPRAIDGRPAIVHVHAEAGAGDNLCLVRYLPMIRAAGFKVRYEAQDELADLVRFSMPEIEVVAKAVDYPGGLGIRDFDYHVPVGELQNAFATTLEDAVKTWRGPYVKADPILADRYRAKLPCPDRSKVGLCWSSGIRFESLWLTAYGRLKSMHFDDLEPLFLAGSDAAFVNLQVGPEREQHRDFGGSQLLDPLPERPTWAETAALVSQLDLVITVDTAVAHLAGAMGKPVWIMMHTQGSWHFMAEVPGSPWNERSPWYPSTRIFRQKEPRVWDDVVARVAAEVNRDRVSRVA